MINDGHFGGRGKLYLLVGMVFLMFGSIVGGSPGVCTGYPSCFSDCSPSPRCGGLCSISHFGCLKGQNRCVVTGSCGSLTDEDSCNKIRGCSWDVNGDPVPLVAVPIEESLNNSVVNDSLEGCVV